MPTGMRVVIMLAAGPVIGRGSGDSPSPSGRSPCHRFRGVDIDADNDVRRAKELLKYRWFEKKT